MALDHCRIVLVEPLYPGNIGATARCMRNFGLTDLVLVAPHADPLDRQACRLSTHGEGILRRARIVPTLAEAVGDCVLVAGTSAKAGGLFRRQSVGTPDEVLPHVIEVLREDRPAAIVFGSEPTGLSNEMISRCHYLIRIPAAEDYSALNLAQAVAICIHALRVGWLETQEQTAIARRSNETLADAAMQERMFEQLRIALEEVHFLYGDKAGELMHAVRRLLGRRRLTILEVKVLFGLARQLRWYVREHGPCEDGSSGHGSSGVEKNLTVSPKGNNDKDDSITH